MSATPSFPDVEQRQRVALIRLWREVEGAIPKVTGVDGMNAEEVGKVALVRGKLEAAHRQCIFAFPEIRFWGAKFELKTPRGKVITIDPADRPEEGMHVSEIRREMNKALSRYRAICGQHRNRLAAEERDRRKQAEKATQRGAKKAIRRKPR